MTNKTIVALIYDFDGTLSPGNMQEFGFIQALGKTPREFWDESEEIRENLEMSSIIAYMKLMIDEAKEKGISLTRESLVSFGKEIQLYPGVKEWFQAVKRYGQSKGVIIEHYINSSGLTEIIEGTPIAHEFKKIFACSFYYGADGNAEWPAVAVDYTAKTQFLFKITKGIMDIGDNRLVNESTADEDKPIPFTNMIYFGDGETDVPCMKIVKMFGGNSIAVYQADKPSKVETARNLLRQERVNFICPADYRVGSEVFNTVCAVIDKVKAESEYGNLQKANRKEHLI